MGGDEVNETTETEETETESEETTETETEESTEEEGSESTESEESTEEETEEEEEEFDATQYLDLKNVPPHLKESAKRMLSGLQKAHTKLRKEAEQAIERYQERLGAQFAEDVQLATGFRQLIQAPGFREFYTDLQNNHPYGFTSVFNKGDNSTNRSNGESGDDSSASQNGTDLNKILTAVEQRMTAIIDARLAPLAKNQARNILEDAEKTLPNFNKYRAHITKLMNQHPTLTPKEAYELASGEDRTKEAIAEAMKKAKTTAKTLSKHRTEKPGAGGGNASTTLTPKKVKDIREAVTLASRQISKG